MDGLVGTVPPFGPVAVGDDGGLWLVKPHDGFSDEHEAVHEWKRTACSHPGMCLADEAVTNWGGLRAFVQALDGAGWEHFPAVASLLPLDDGADVPVEVVGRILGELDFFVLQARLADEIWLVDADTGDERHRFIGVYDGIIGYGPHPYGVDHDGFFVLDPATEPPETVFRARRFEQRMLPDGRLELSDGQQIVQLDMRPIGEFEGPIPGRFGVETRAGDPARYDYLVGPLRRLCEASLNSGNPISLY
ncbi:hypothetical protein [Actinoplanes couchii]|uniref:Uncharacterized protein n=1 Tax=Actinoplanes couchii TaxID=403638 RepID=A0ABQ3X775_9ACTN|nr:hypothetical protein [Actinoplanes couchii]MDR6322206.1 hypothetical protein [Actinoplanes couchii]GID54368.1 hypothetical protein Aco03nite_027720 [Actinoplanes couchii]